MRRVYGPDFMLAIVQAVGEARVPPFSLRREAGCRRKTKRADWKRSFPSINIVGTYTPPFRPLTPEEDDELIGLINQTQPDIVWVGLSTPKQERFMAQYIERLNTNLLVGVGAAFDIHAGFLRMRPTG